MAATPIPFSTKDNVTATLASGINASVTSIPLTTGDGAKFPQPYNSTCTSTGSATTLNSTGISAAVGGSAVIGKIAWNKTDGSIGVITAVATDSITTTRLLGGTLNVWTNADVWCIDPFVVTFEIVATSAYGVQSTTTREEALIIGRSTDTLTVATGGRGYGSDPANTFSASDSVYLHVTSPIIEKLRDIVSVLGVQVNTNVTDIATNVTDITAQKTGSYHYIAAGGSSSAYTAATPALAAYAAGNIIRFKANHTNTGATTLNVNSLGAQAIKKNDGATALAANDIISGQIVTVVYDGTNFQMLSPIGTPATITYYDKTVYASGADSTNASSFNSSTSQVNFDTHTYAITANTLIAGVGFEFEIIPDVTWVSGNITFAVRLGSTDIADILITPSASEGGILRGFIMGTAGAGASVAVRGGIQVLYAQEAGDKEGASYGTANVATNGSLTLQLSGQFSASNATHAITIRAARFRKFSTSAFA